MVTAYYPEAVVSEVEADYLPKARLAEVTDFMVLRERSRTRLGKIL